MEYALNAQPDGILDPIKSAIQLTISVELGMTVLEFVKHAIKDTLYLVVNVLEIQLILHQSLIHFVLYGKIKYAKNVLIEPIFIMVSAHKLAITVKLGTTMMENA